jgi:dUTPase
MNQPIPPAMRCVVLRTCGDRKSPVPTSSDDGFTWTLFFIPHRKEAIDIAPKHSVELETGVRLNIPPGYEASVSHVLYRGRPDHLRPCLTLRSVPEDKTTEIRVPVVNITNETIRLDPGAPLAYLTLMPLRRSHVEKM